MSIFTAMYDYFDKIYYSGKSQQYRTQELNREDALQRLVALIKSAVVQQKKRRPTKPTRSSQKKRVDKKTQRGQTKVLRGKVKF